MFMHILVMAIAFCVVDAFSILPPRISTYMHLHARNLPPLTPQPSNPRSSIVSTADMEKFTSLLKSFAEKLDAEPEGALSLASANVQWLLSKNIPSMAQRLLNDDPALRKDEGMMQAYIFLMDFVETVSKGTVDYLEKHQGSMRLLLEAAGKGEKVLNDAIAENRERLVDPGFLVYVDSEIEGAAKGTPAEQALSTIRLRLLELVGEGLSPDVAVLPRLLSEDTDKDLRKATLAYLKDLSTPGKDLFLLNLRLLKKEMVKKYDSVDPDLMSRMEKIEDIVVETMRKETSGGGFKREPNELQ
jgi:hypothetical protein